MAARDLHLFSIPPGASFLDTLADRMIAGDLVGDIGWGRNPLGVADVTVYLPTRRAARAFAGVLGQRADGPAVLPRIVPLGDADEAELRLLGDEDIGDLASDDAPPADTARRLVVLADLVMKWRDQLALAVTPLGPGDHRLIAGSATEAFSLAADLARVLDTLNIEGIKAERLATSVPGEYDEYWDIARKFLAIATQAWPNWLAGEGLSDPVARRNAVLRRRARQVAEGGAPGPIIAAGSTGTNPATAELLRAIARHPRGAVVLPALDRISSEESFAAVANAEKPQHGHPQAALAKLLARIEATRNDVKEIGAAPPELAAREAVLAQAMQPPELTAQWASLRADEDVAASTARALENASVIVAPTDREEALAIALAMRETIETPGRTAALATPDRALAERVGVALRRWGIAVDDSAGRSLARSPRGSLAALASRWLAAPADGALMMALIAYPCVGCGLSREHMRRAAAVIDIGLLRGYPAVASLASLRELAPQRRKAAGNWRTPLPAQRLSDADWDIALGVLDALIAVEKKFAGEASAAKPIATWTQALRAALESLTTGDDGDSSWLFDERDGEALRDLFESLAASGESAPLTSGEFPGVVGQLLDSVILTPPTTTHPRLSIWGLLEARLLTADRIILGGLSETVWPPQPAQDAFLNRAMRTTLGLPLPERRIGQTAHDFTSIFAGARDAILTRSRKSSGAPTIPSRFWQRLSAYVGADSDAWRNAEARGEAYLAWACALDETAQAKPIERPAPKPPSRLVPRKLSVSRIETLVRDPYAIYAKDILGLEPLPGIGATADAALRGTLVHEAVGLFAKEIDPFAPDALEKLVTLGEKLFASSGIDAERILFWAPRFRRAAGDYVAWERTRRPFLATPKPGVEESGALSLTLGDGSSFQLSARADRIERLKNGTLAIVDFKTGAPPTRKEVQQGYAPQLTLEAAMAARGKFSQGDLGRRVAALIYIRLSGGKSGAFETDLAMPPTAKGEFVDPQIVPEKHVEQLVRRMNALVNGRMGFTSQAHPDPRRPNAEGDYDHLARVAEWSRGSDGDE